MTRHATAAALATAAILVMATAGLATAADADAARQRADEAYQLRLWDVAARQYQALIAREEDPRARASLAIRTAECLIRLGSPEAALELLESQPAAHPAAVDFWRGQALAGLGRFAEAVEALGRSLENPESPFRIEGALTSASLMLSLGDFDGALRVLADASAASSGNGRIRLDVQRAAMLADAGQLEEARAVLPEEAAIPAAHLPFARLVKARCLLAEGAAEEAAGLFATLVEDPAGQSIAVHHAASLGLSDAVFATSGADAASRILLAFLAEHPESPLLDGVFSRLLMWLPAAPAANDPVMAKLAEWIPQPSPPATGLIQLGDSPAAAWPTSRITGELAAFAMFARAVGLHRIGTPAARHEARRLLSRLRLEFPSHFLARRSLITEGGWRLEQGDTAGALHRLAVAAETARSPGTRGEAIFLEAHAAAKSGDTARSAAMFEKASTLLEDDLAAIASYNAAIALLRENPEVESLADPANPDLAADLALERALANPSPDASVPALDAFLANHPAHPRAAEARLAAAERALASTPPDVSLARAQLDTLESLGTAPPVPNARTRISLVQLRIAENDGRATGADAPAIELARAIIAESPESPAAAEATLTLGRLLFEAGDFNEARINFEKLAAANTPAAGSEQQADDAHDPALAQTAWLLAARAAALGATTQSREEALALFDRAIAIDAPLRDFARLEKARHLIDLNRLDAAITFLRESIAAIPAEDPQQLPAGLLLGEAVYAKGTGDPASLEEALAIYDGLLPHAATHPALFHRLQYLRGMTLEKLPRPDAPHLRREAEAIEAYYSVIQRAGDQPPVEWEWFERCAFAALALLEKAERWNAAINLARKIAAFNGPRANDAAERASQLQLKHLIWED